jgi:hypothetical protein
MEIVTGTIVAASKRAPAGLGLAAENVQEASFRGGTGKKTALNRLSCLPKPSYGPEKPGGIRQSIRALAFSLDGQVDLPIKR